MTSINPPSTSSPQIANNDHSRRTSHEDGGARILAFLGYMFARHDPSEKVFPISFICIHVYTAIPLTSYVRTSPPPPQTPPLPAELAEWAQDTAVATGAGIVIGGFMQWRAEKALGPVQPPPDAPTKARAAKVMAEEQTRRLLRTLNGAVKGGIRFGGLAAVYYGMQLAGSIYRGRHDFYNSVIGGMAAGSLLGQQLGMNFFFF